MRILFVFPGNLDTPTGGYRYDRAIIRQLEVLGHDVIQHSLSGSYPFPSDTDKQLAIDSLASVGDQQIAVVDGLAGGVLPEFMRALAAKMPVIALVHHPLCLENGLDEDAASRLEESERCALQVVKGVITTSPATSRTTASLFGVAPESIHCVLPGLEVKVRASTIEEGTVNLLCVGSVIERKGHTHLVSALGKLADLDWQLDCIGETRFQPDLFSSLQQQIVAFGLADKIRFHGAVSQEALSQFYRKAHVFVLPSLYEGYGMAYAEAISSGLPVIGTTAGAIPDTVPDGCGILVEPENSDELADALKSMIMNADVRNRMHADCLAARDRFPDWQRSGAQFADILEGAL